MADSKIGNSAGNRGKGRKKGQLNKVTAMAKDAIAQAAEKLGGVKRLVAWAKEDSANERVFWGTIYPKLLPLQMNHSGSIDTSSKEQRDAAVAAATRADR